MTTKHEGFTPGPWIAEHIPSPCGELATDQHEWRISAFAGGIIAWVDTPDNACLIAATPDLLAERDRLAEQVGVLREALDNLMITLVKTGDNANLSHGQHAAFIAARDALESTKG